MGTEGGSLVTPKWDGKEFHGKERTACGLWQGKVLDFWF
jgi:hypothetical protein